MTAKLVRGALAGSTLAMLGTGAIAAGVAGVDIVVTRNPPPPMPSIVVATTDGSGRFYARVLEAGTYTLSTACRMPPCRPYAVSISATGATLEPAPGGSSYSFAVARRPVVLRGLIEAAPSAGDQRDDRGSAAP